MANMKMIALIDAEVRRLAKEEKVDVDQLAGMIMALVDVVAQLRRDVDELKKRGE